MNAETPERSIAVLPLLNLSPDHESEYFSDGMTEEIINALTKVQGLKVTARTSSFAYKGKDIDAREIGRTLGVSTLLEGSVRKFGNRLRIMVQLVQVDDGFHLWSNKFDRQLEDVFALQDEISLLVADKIRENFGHLEMQDQLVVKATRNIEAYDYFLKGRALMLKWTLPDIERAIECYKEAIAQDENFVRAYYEVVWCYYILISWGYYDKGEAEETAAAYFHKAKSIDCKLAEYHFCLATKSFWLDWNFEGAYQQLLKTLEINPQYSLALEGMAELMLAAGHFDIGLEYINKGLEVDPLSANHNYTKAHLLYYSGKGKQAIPYFDKALDLKPDFELAYGQKALCLIHLNDEAELLKHVSSGSLSVIIETLNKLVHTPVEKLPKQVLSAATPDITLLPWRLYLLTHSDKIPEAEKLLEKYLEKKLGQLINYNHDPLLAPILQCPSITKLSGLDFIPLRETQEKDNTLIETDGAELELEKLMQEEKLYLQPDLSLRSLADKMEMNPNKLSWLINEALGKNFNEYINSFRLETFKKKALDPSNSHITLLGLAYESGFNSKSAFNDFFKKSTGMTPRSWVKSKEIEHK